MTHFVEWRFLGVGKACTVEQKIKVLKELLHTSILEEDEGKEEEGEEREEEEEGEEREEEEDEGEEDEGGVTVTYTLHKQSHTWFV